MHEGWHRPGCRAATTFRPTGRGQTDRPTVLRSGRLRRALPTLLALPSLAAAPAWSQTSRCILVEPPLVRSVDQALHAAPPRSVASASGSAVIDVVFLRSSKIPASVDVASQVSTWISQTNKAFANSGVSLTVRSLGIWPAPAEVSAADTECFESVTDVVQAAYVHAKPVRERVGADIVFAITWGCRSRGSGFGAAYQFRSPDAHKPWAYAAIEDHSWWEIFAHELGHNLGLDHNAAACAGLCWKDYGVSYVGNQADLSPPAGRLGARTATTGQS